MHDQHPMLTSTLRRTTALTLLAAAVGACFAAPAPVDLSPVPAVASPVKLPKGWHHGAFMEVFVRAYQDSDGDGVGDLPGLISRLDYLKDLGVRGLWLMPIQANADGDHGYATRDFRSVAPEYGTLADFDRLVREAARRGIGVIIDYAVNHAAAEHPLFVAARADANSPWRDWFVFSAEAPQGWDIWGKNPWYWNGPTSWSFNGEARDTPPGPPGARDFYFGTFGPNMPDFNLRRPEVVDYHLDSLRFWLNRGLAGYRLDAVPHLVENSAKDWNDQPESRALTHRIAQMIRAYPNRYVVCEATAEPQAWGDPAVCTTSSTRRAASRSRWRSWPTTTAARARRWPRSSPTTTGLPARDCGTSSRATSSATSWRPRPTCCNRARRTSTTARKSARPMPKGPAWRRTTPSVRR
jgi:alpha-amylase